MMNAALTSGVDHVGLTVPDLAASQAFFTDCLGWTLLGEKPDYPAAFVSDGVTRVTLWPVKDREGHVPFDRHRNVGLHHLAFRVVDLPTLHAIHERVAKWPGAVVEFAPEPSGTGPKVHCMIREPGGNRIEFAYLPQDIPRRAEG
ncbi:VOC family protein [Pseudaminobacter sp. 19-2017]|uniref:VOC family protein n=1 Tax=Pseudaminobacter soli (ex Zhang et al. 2022) TaxID=2831468 RepID=A0A942E5S6_9HYPH|nr:VOC family protein [Pseudaminobacter soli]MBS3651745.1 VOC family protein [Pseudaminobacter soli]